jgi:hypothetical protein
LARREKGGNMYQVIVVGGGMSGSIAAIAAARNGAKTLLIEQYGFLGGMMTAAGVGPMMTFHAGDKLIVKGITNEVIENLVKKGKSPGHILDTTGYTYTVTPFDVEALKMELEQMCLEAGVEILYHTMLAEVLCENASIQSIRVCNKAGLSTYKAHTYIDATGDADLSAWAGVECTLGEPTTGKRQAMSMMLRVNNVDIEKTKNYILNHKEEFPRLKDDITRVNLSCRLSIGGFDACVRKAKEMGDFSLPRNTVLFFETNNEGEVIINTSHIYDLDNLKPDEYSLSEIEGRKQANDLYGMFKKYIPGFGDAKLISIGPFVGVRSSRQIHGEYKLSDEDVANGCRFEDAIAFSAYPCDIHSGNKNRDIEKESNENRKEVKESWGKIKSLPYRCLVNPKVDNLITVGRCVSLSFRAQGAFRTAPIVGAIGNAGGIAAAMSVAEDIPARNVNVSKLRAKILEQDGYIQ